VSFDTVTFWLFFALAWAAWRWLPFGAAKASALAASLLFYGWWNPLYLPLIVVSALVDFHAAQRIQQSEEQGARRAWLAVSLTCNLGLLGFFKYTPLAAESAWALMGAGGELPWPETTRWVVPVGISFYTFQTLSYSLDVYRRRLEPIASFRDFLLFVSFFPQLVAGPIVRAGQVLPQLTRRRPLRAETVQRGLEHVVTGLFLKIVVGDNLAPAVARVFESTAISELSPAAAWTGALCFTAQIFADFAGYSGIAIGLAYLMGLRFPVNFDWPHVSRSLSEFWSRWHISLSTWLRDYLYVSLGGNRSGRARTLVNVLITMLLGGLWHGAAWTYVIWGALHGLGLCLERLVLGERRPRAHSGPPRSVGGMVSAVAGMVYVNVYVTLALVVFRADGLDTALAVLERLLIAPFQQSFGWDAVADWRHLSLVGVVVLMHFGGLLREWKLFPSGRMPRAVLAGVCLALLIAVRRDTVQEFLYFQF
jgi:alginate O-acetyltransferase complex protein AlgI